MDYTDLYPYASDMDGSEAEVLCFALDRARWQFAWKTGGLTAEQLRRRHPPSTMTLAGLIKHMLCVDEFWTAIAQGRQSELPWTWADIKDIEDWDWKSAVDDEPDDLYGLWYAVVERSRTAWRDMSKDGGLDVHLPGGTDSWIMNRRGMVVNLLEEYHVHSGHADVLREAVDGLIGFTPPHEVQDA
jgi:Protein of unknown function (DUF664)